ncbi:MAG: SMP-30/gluconolactonase/LRE family protein [Acidobacteria bacterium]|nr:SMP-30/gluconolactonase/LRE family protein [Acidobacteriota bacterium]
MLYPISEVRNFVVGLDHPECAAAGPDGRLYAGGEGGQVYRISPDGRKVEVLANTGGFCLGITLDQDQNIYVCDMGVKALLKVTQKGKVTKLADSAGGRKFVNPNFSVFDSQGNLYFSDSGEWKQANGVIYKLGRGGKVRLFSEGPYHFANGLAIDAAEEYLYIIESNLDRVLRVELKPDGTAGVPRVYAEGMIHVPDGMAFDAEGNLYVTTYASNCIYRITPDRKVELLCQDLDNLFLCQATNCAFGGPNFDQLYIGNLGRNHISVLDLKIKGQPLWCHRGLA